MNAFSILRLLVLALLMVTLGRGEVLAQKAVSRGANAKGTARTAALAQGPQGQAAVQESGGGNIVNSGESFHLDINTLPAGDNVVITFEVTVDNPFPIGVTQVSNQGTVSGSNFASLLTDDPDDPTSSADPTVTMVINSDVGVIAINSPTTNCDPDNAVPVTITIGNFTAQSQTGFDVSFEVTGPINTGPVTENIGALVIPGNGDAVYTFTATADLSTPGTYTVTASTDLTSDGNPGNDSHTEMVSSFPPVFADAGPDRDLCPGGSTSIGGSPTASGGTPPFTYLWSPSTGLSSTTDANPTANPNTTTTYTVVVTDANNCTANDQVVVNVASHNLVFLANGLIKINQNKESDGGIHTNNGRIEFGSGLAPGTHTGDLNAGDDIVIATGNTIIGNARAGDDIFLSGSATITGTQTENATICFVPLPSLSYTAGGPNRTVSKNGTLTLPPGSYNVVTVRQNGKLNVSAGNYYMNILDTDASAQIIADVSAGNVYLNVVTELEFDPNVKVNIIGAGASTEKVTIRSRQTFKVDIGSNSIIRGNLIVPSTEVHFEIDCKFKGSLTANKISLDARVKYQHHSSVAPFPKIDGSDDPVEPLAEEEETEEAVVTDYALAQNYPNPFNPTTRIAFNVKEAGEVLLTIYNLTGQEVRTLVSGTMEAGEYEMHWDGRDNAGQHMPSGIYLYKLRVNGFEQVKKMTLMK